MESRTCLAGVRLDFTLKLNFTTDVQIMVYLFPSGMVTSSVAAAPPEKPSNHRITCLINLMIHCHCHSLLSINKYVYHVNPKFTLNIPPGNSCSSSSEDTKTKPLVIPVGIWHSHSPKSSTTMQSQHARPVQKHCSPENQQLEAKSVIAGKGNIIHKPSSCGNDNMTCVFSFTSIVGNFI